MDVEIHATSAFSFLRGASLPEDLVERAADLGYGAVALLDHDGFYGAPRFYKAARARGLRALCGAVLGVEASGVSGRVGLYVQHPEGYRNLCRLITHAKMRVSKDHARAHGVSISVDELAEQGAGLTALLLADEHPLREPGRGNSAAYAWARALVRALGPERCAVEQCRHLDRRQARAMAALEDLAQSLGVRCVASNDVRFAAPDAARVADVFACARAHTTLDGAGTLLAPNRERHFKRPGEFRTLFADRPEWLDHARALAESCEFTLADLGYRFPEYPLPPGETPAGYLRRLAFLGARERYRAGSTERAFAQIERELALIHTLELEGYFLVVWDIVRFCRERGIMVQGRGSAANSAVCYALAITAVDPVRMELLFERFLSEERGEWPDIDLDLPSGERREEVIQYVYQRYGERGAAMTANVITYRARSAVRESAKALGFPTEALDRLSRHISWGNADRDELAARVSEAGFALDEPRVALMIDTAARMQNLPRHLGQHSGGMVIAAGRLDEVCPLEPASMPGRVVVQWDKDDCADLGILKVDLLGLGMMALLEEAVPLVETHDGARIDLAQLPHDEATYDMLCRADTVGVFQVESRAQMATLPRLKPRTFYDLVVEVAIIRPGPIVGQLVHPYLDRRAGRAPVTYPHPSLEPILARTLGVPLFQEQLMRVAMEAAGFTGGEAEELRRAMGSKRSLERMAALEKKLREGMSVRGYAAEAQDEVVRGIMSFALYGFPESHAASFALLAYASAYLKCHYPASFTCALLNQWPMGFYHPATVVKDAQRHGVSVLPVDVTVSRWTCAREHRAALASVGEGGVARAVGTRGALRLGLKYVRGLREHVGLAVERERARAPFASVDDFARRTGARGAELSALAELGALSSLPRAAGGRWTRRSALWQVHAVAGKPPGELFARADTLEGDERLPEMSPAERIAADYRASGLTVGPHPMALRRAELSARGVLTAAQLVRCANHTAASVAGAVITRQRPGTAKGFFFLTVEDETGLVNAIVSPALYESERRAMVAAPVLVLHGTVQQQDGVSSLKVVHAEPLAWEDGEAELPESHDFR